MKKICKFGVVAVVLTILMLAMSLQAFATERTVLDGKITISDSANSSSVNGTTYTATAKGSLFGAKTSNITIKNTSENKAIITFDYTVATASTFTIDGANGGTSGSVEKTLEVGETIVIVLKSNQGISNTTATLTLENFNYTAVIDSANVTFEFDSELGSVTINGADITSGTVETVEAAAPPVVKVTPAAGQVFIGWINISDNTKISTDAEYTWNPTGDMTVRALFSDNIAPYFMVDETYIYDNLDDALKAGTNLVLMCDAVFEAGEYTIPAGTSLLIPFDANNTMYDKSKFPTGVQGYTNPSVYRTLTMKSGAKFIVNGALNVSANHSSSQGTTGAPTGKYALINMQQDSSITVNAGGTLYAWGYITGSGAVMAKKDATVYENFQVMDYRGGTAVATSMYNNDQRVFPMSQYYVQNIEVPLTLEEGAVENGYMSVFVTGQLGGADTINGTAVPFIGPDGMFCVTSGSITKDYDEGNDRLIINISNGTLGMESLSISLKVVDLLGATEINSAAYTLPVNGNITLNVLDSDVTITQDIALLPGSEINVDENSSVTFYKGVQAFIYDRAEWDKYCAHTNKTFIPVKYAPGRRYTRADDYPESTDLKDAVVKIAGTIDASAAFVYTTKSGANICGVEGGFVKLQQGTKTVTYQATQSGTSVSYPEIPVTTAKLKNDKESYSEYTEPGTNTDYCLNYEYSDGVWDVAHTNLKEVEAKSPTCTDIGWEEYEFCSDCAYTTYVEIPALGHDKESHEAQAASCEGIGWNAYETCKRCDYTTYDEIDALGHDKESHEAQAASCEGIGWNAYETCKRCDYTTYEEIPALGHDILNYPAQAPTCKEVGWHDYRACTRCDYTTYGEIPAIGHSYGDWINDGANHKKICANNSEHIITEEHAFEDLICTGCGCEKRVTSTEYSIVDGNIELNTSLVLDVEDDAYVITATYDGDGRLLNVSLSKAADITKVSMPGADVATVKVFVWSDLILMKPTSFVEELVIN